MPENTFIETGSFLNRISQADLERLKIRQFTSQEIKEVITANRIIDYLSGHQGLVGELTREERELIARNDKAELIDRLRRRSVLELSFSVPPQCDAHCSICYTDAGNSSVEECMDLDQSEAVIEAAVELGAKSFFVAGVGEPTMDERLFKLLDMAEERQMEKYVFVNGLSLSNDLLAQEYWRMNSRGLLNQFRLRNVNLGPKLWCMNKEKFERLTGTKGDYRFGKIDGKEMPLLFKLLEDTEYPPEQVIINLAVTSENFVDVDDVLSFCLNRGYKVFLEEFVQTGRAAGKRDLSLTEKQRKYILPLAVGRCIKPKIQLAVSYDGYLMECKAVKLERRSSLQMFNQEGRLKDLAQIRQMHKGLVRARQHSKPGRYCELNN